jgi:hypothetical protein
LIEKKIAGWLKDTTIQEFFYEINHQLVGDFVSMPNEEIRRYTKLEKLMKSKLPRRFKVRRLDLKNIAYVIEHIYEEKGTPLRIGNVLAA